MNTLNIPFKFGTNNIKILIELNYLNSFLFFIGKIDFLCNNKYTVPVNQNNKLYYNIVDLKNYKIDKMIEPINNFFSNIEITDSEESINTKSIIIFMNKSKIEINFNFDSKSEYIIKQLLSSFNIFKKTFNGNTYSLIENENKFIQEYNSIKNYNIENTSLFRLLEEQVNKNNNSIAIKFKKREITYQEFYKKIKKLSTLITTYTNRGDSVSILLDKSDNIVIVIWAILYSGCSYVPIDINDPIERIKFIIKNSNSKLIITEKIDFEINIDKININDINYKNIIEKEKYIDYNEDLAYILHTSGTTGQPKGVKISREGLLNYSLYQIETLRWGKNDIIIQKTPYIWDVSLRELIVPFIAGSSVIITESEKHKDPEYILDLIKKENATFVHFVPSMLSIFLEFIDNQTSLDSITNVVCSGEALTDQLRIKFYKYFMKATLYNMYGPTEATVEVTNYTCPKIDFDLKMHIGKTIPNTPLLILNNDGVLLPKGITGELHIGGPQVSLGYINQEKLTDNTFVKSKYVKGKLYKTGDLSKLLKDHNIEYLGRIDTQIKIRGMRIEINEIKKNILKYDGTSDCYVTIYKNNNKDYLLAYVSPNNLNISNLIKHISKFLPKQMIPDKFIKMEEFPISKNGKLDKKNLPLPDFSNTVIQKKIEISEELLKSTIMNFFEKNKTLENKSMELFNLILQKSNNIDTNYLKIFSKLLNIPISEIDLDLNLEYLGIDSIKMMSLQSNLKKENYFLSVYELDKYKTIRKIYDYLKVKDNSEKKIFNIDYYFDMIDSIIDDKDDYICIHSSLANLNLDLTDVKELISKLINKWTNKGITILIPSFTIESFPREKKYKKSEYLTEVGILAEIVYNMKDSLRTDCPFYSFVVIGNNKEQFINQLPETSLGINSVFEYCEKYDIKIISIGTHAMTQFHRYEEIYQVPYRYFKNFEGVYINKNNNKFDINQRHYVRDNLIEVNNLDDCKILDILGKYLKTLNIGETFIKYIKTNEMKKILYLFFKDPFILCENKKKIIKKYVNDKNYIFKKFIIESSPIMIHFLNDRNISNINSDFYQYIILDIVKDININIIFESIEKTLFNFSSLFYYLDNKKFYLDYNLRNNIREKFRTVDNNLNIEILINQFANELNINIGDNFRVLYVQNCKKLIFIVNHFFIDGISWRLLMENLDKSLNNEKLNEETNRFDIWSEQLLNINTTKSEVDFWNNIHQSINKFISTNSKSYSNKYSKIKKFEIKISDKKQNINLRNYTLNKLLKTLFTLYETDSIALNIETHGREDITFINNMNEMFGWFTSYFPIIFHKKNFQITEIENKFKQLNKNGIYYLLLKYNFIKKYSLIKEKNKIDILFNFMGDFSFESDNFKLLEIGEKGDCGHILTYWFDIKSNNSNGCILNCNLFYLENHISEKQIDMINNLLVDNMKNI